MITHVDADDDCDGVIEAKTDMKFVTSSSSSASVKKKLARVKLSRGNAQSVFSPRCNSVEKAPRGQRCKNYPRVVNR